MQYDESTPFCYIIDEVLYHNNAIAVPDLLTREMIQAGVKRHRRDIYIWGLEHESGERARHPDPAALYRCLLPSRRCSITESGLKVDDMYYLPEVGSHELLLAQAKRSRRSVPSTMTTTARISYMSSIRPRANGLAGS